MKTIGPQLTGAVFDLSLFFFWDTEAFKEGMVLGLVCLNFSLVTLFIYLVISNFFYTFQLYNWYLNRSCLLERTDKDTRNPCTVLCE